MGLCICFGTGGHHRLLLSSKIVSVSRVHLLWEFFLFSSIMDKQAAYMQQASVTRVSVSAGWGYAAIDTGAVIVQELGQPHLQRFACDVSRDATTAPMLYVPEEVAMLTMQGAWSSLMALARWNIPIAWPQAHHRDLLENARRVEGKSAASPADASMLRGWVSQLRAWAPRIVAGDTGTAKAALCMTIDQMEDAAKWLDPADPSDLADDPQLKMIQSLRMAFDLRDRSNMKRVLKRCVDLMTPSTLRSVLLKRLETFSVRVMSASSVSRHQVYLDCAMMLLQRERRASLPEIYAWQVDSSPQLGRDFLLIRSTSVPGRSLHEFDMKLRRLICLELSRLGQQGRSAIADRASDGPGSDGECMHTDEKQDSARADLIQDLRDLISLHIFPPVGLGAGATSLAHKVSAFCYSLFMETGSRAALCQVLDSTFAFVTDMGTECGLADFMCEDLSSILPEWLDAGLGEQLEPDCAQEPDSPSGGAAAAAAVAAVPGQYLFKSCVVISGLSFHIVKSLNAFHF